MSLIKKVIEWIISFFRRLFGKRKKKISFVTNPKKKNNHNEKISNSFIEQSLPDFMIIGSQEKNILINNIINLKKELSNNKQKEKTINNIMDLLKNNENLDNQYIEKYLKNNDWNESSTNKINDLLSKCNPPIKEEIMGMFTNTQIHDTNIKRLCDSLDEILLYVKNNDVSFGGKDLINNEMQVISRKFENNELDNYDKDILDKIKNWNKEIISEVKLEFEKVNYVTLSTVMIDKIINQYQDIYENYQNHRYNKYYYEKELNKLKEQINYLKNIKNSPKIQLEISQLRKELFTKSKDKYDILYNNEVFINISQKCDELLNKVNKRVIDIKNKEKESTIEDSKKRQREYLEKIIKRFEDLNLSRKLVLQYCEKEKELFDEKNYYNLIEYAYQEFLNSDLKGFNYQRNKVKTELVKLYNDLCMIIALKKKEGNIMLLHINFQMTDLVDAVTIKKNEVESFFEYKKENSNSLLVDKKIEDIRNRFMTNIKSSKVLKKEEKAHQ